MFLITYSYFCTISGSPGSGLLKIQEKGFFSFAFCFLHVPLKKKVVANFKEREEFSVAKKKSLPSLSAQAGLLLAG